MCPCFRGGGGPGSKSKLFKGGKTISSVQDDLVIWYMYIKLIIIKCPADHFIVTTFNYHVTMFPGTNHFFPFGPFCKNSIMCFLDDFTFKIPYVCVFVKAAYPRSLWHRCW